MREPRAVVRTYTDAWLSGDLATLLGLYHEDIVLHYGGSNPLSGDHVGRDAALAVLLAVQEKTQRVPLAVIDVMGSHDHAAAWIRERWTVDGTDHELTRVLVYRVADDQLVECWVYDNDQALIDRAFSA
jgi:ketosteroid isomerase-like protein